MSSKPKIHQIQALRALAALLVVSFHAKLSPGGFIGVDIFYVISGYLITGLVIRELKQSESFSFQKFYLRRAKRLLPASFTVLTLTAIIGWFILPPTIRASLGKDVLAASLYISNYLFAWWQNDYQNLNVTPSPVIHYWSLAVEEQFYLFWPIIVYLLWRIGRHRSVAYGVLTVTCISLGYSIYLTSTKPIWAFYSLPTRAWELGIGALILFVPRHFAEGRQLLQKISIWSGLVAILFSVLHFSDTTPFPGYNALVPTIGTALLISGIPHWPLVLDKISQLRIIQWLGEISYPLYLWHWPLLVLPSSKFGRPLTMLERFFFIMLTLLAADMTHRYLEKPIADRNVSNKIILRSSIAATCICALISVGILSTSSITVALKNGRSVAVSDVLKKPKIYLDGCHLSYGQVKSGDCIYGDKTADTTLVLYGDSHAAQWFPALEALAQKHNFKLISLTKSSCPAVEVQQLQIGSFRNSDCNTWRRDSLQRIKAINPAAIFTSSFQYYSPVDRKLNRQRWWSEGEIKTYQSLLGLSTNLIYISDTPHPLRDIPNCLASNGGEKCDDSEKSDPRIWGNFIKVDPTVWLCESKCPAMVNGTVAYRDASHISVEMSRALAPELENVLNGLGIL